MNEKYKQLELFPLDTVDYIGDIDDIDHRLIEESLKDGELYDVEVVHELIQEKIEGK